MIKYKPWNTEVSNACDNEEVSDEIFCKKWNSFLQTDLCQQLVPDWRRHLANAEIYFSNESVNDDSEDTIDTNDFPREDWMYLAELSKTHKLQMKIRQLMNNIRIRVTRNSLKRK